MIFYLFLVGAFLGGVGKAVADIIRHQDLWIKSVFSRFKIDGFLGSSDKSYIRKHQFKNPIIKFIMQTWLVALTDLWHFANMVYRQIAPALLLIWVYLYRDDITYPWIMLIEFLTLPTLFFHMFYMIILRESFWNSNKNRTFALNKKSIEMKYLSKQADGRWTFDDVQDAVDCILSGEDTPEIREAFETYEEGFSEYFHEAPIDETAIDFRKFLKLRAGVEELPAFLQKK